MGGKRKGRLNLKPRQAKQPPYRCLTERYENEAVAGKINFILIEKVRRNRNQSAFIQNQYVRHDRQNGLPAVIRFHENGQLSHVSYFDKGVRHNHEDAKDNAVSFASLTMTETGNIKTVGIVNEDGKLKKIKARKLSEDTLNFFQEYAHDITCAVLKKPRHKTIDLRHTG